MIIRPEVLPEEYAPGYKGRVMGFNRMTDPKVAMQALMEWSGNAGTSRRDFSTVELLAKVAGIEAARFVRAHTALPLRRAVVATLPEVEHGCPSQRSLLWSVALRGIRPGAYLCTQCVLEDLDFHGMPYWRREHQLPGLYCCSKHGRPLGYVETANAFLSPPSAFYEHHHPVDHRWVKRLDRSETVQRFLSITSDLLARSRPLEERDVSRAAKVRATALGLHTGRGAVERKLVSDLIRERFNTTWLTSVLPGLVEKPVGEFWFPVDGALSGKRMGLSPTTYAIVFAALFESPDQAINAMLVPSPPDSVSARLNPAPIEVTDQRLRDAYIECRGCHAAAARKLGLSSYGARRRLQEQGLPNLGAAASPSVRNAAAAVFIEGASIDQASSEHNIDRAELERLLIQSASPLRAALTEIRRSEQPRAMPPRAKPTAPPRQRRRTEPALVRLAAGYNELTPVQNVTQ
jgi:hypothetical protein